MTRHFHSALLMLLPMPVLAAEPTDVRDYGSGDMRTLHEGDANEFTLRDITRPDEVMASPSIQTLFSLLQPLLDIYSNPVGLLDDEPEDRVSARWAPLKLEDRYNSLSIQTHQITGYLHPVENLALQLDGFQFGRNISINTPSSRVANAALAWQATDAIQTGFGGTVMKTDEDSWEGHVLRGGIAFKPAAYLQLGLHGIIEKGIATDYKADSSQLGVAMLASGGVGTPRFALRLSRVAEHEELTDDEEEEETETLDLMARALHTIALQEGKSLDIGARLNLQQARDKGDSGDDDKSRQQAIQLGAAYRTDTAWVGGQAGRSTFIYESDYGEETQTSTVFQLGTGGRFPADNGEVTICPSAGLGRILEKMEREYDDGETFSADSKATRLSLGVGIEWSSLALDLALTREKYSESDLRIETLMLAGAMEF